MTITKKEGLLKRLFGVKESGCCKVKIEEIKEDEDVDQKKQQPEVSASCCNTRGKT